jgi:hypothetical protein
MDQLAECSTFPAQGFPKTDADADTDRTGLYLSGAAGVAAFAVLVMLLRKTSV